MPDRFPSCFGGCAAAVPPAPPEADPNLTTSIYDTHLGTAALTWSRAVLGLTLGADLSLSGEGGKHEEPLHFCVRPLLLWKRRGSRRFRLRNHPRHRRVDFVWDLSRACFRAGGGRPEPTSGFFVAVAIDGEMLLVAGDLVEEAYKKTQAQRPRAPFPNPAPTSRREHVVLGDPGSGRRSYRTMVRFGGRDREISIDLGAKGKEREAGMAVAVDGERVLHVRRLQWKFRGTDMVEVEGGAARMQVSWDLHDWLFPSKDDAAAGAAAAAASAATERGRAVFVFRFEEEVAKPGEGHLMKVFGDCKGTVFRSTLQGRSRNWSDNSSSGGCGAERRRIRRKNLLKTASSSSSTSSASSASSSSVMDWESQEEIELQLQDGFSLLILRDCDRAICQAIPRRQMSCFLSRKPQIFKLLLYGLEFGLRTEHVRRAKANLLASEWRTWRSCSFLTAPAERKRGGGSRTREGASHAPSLNPAGKRLDEGES